MEVFRPKTYTHAPKRVSFLQIL